MRTVIETSTPSIYPVDVTEVKDYLKTANLTTNPGADEILEAFIIAATDWAEKYTKKAFINRTVRETIDANGMHADNVQNWYYLFQQIGFIEMSLQPLVSISSVQYYDRNDNIQTYATSNYEVDTDGNRLVFTNNANIPSSMRRYKSFVINYTAGYGTSASSVPKLIRTAIKQAVADMYNVSVSYRGAGAGLDNLDTNEVLTNKTKMLLDTYRRIHRIN